MEEKQCFTDGEAEYNEEHEEHIYKTREGMGCLECDKAVADGLKDIQEGN